MNVPAERAELPGFLFRTVGYALLILSFFNLIDIVLPPQFMDSAWEFQTFGAIVESSPIPLMGLAFLFYGKMEGRQKWEVPVLRWVSWLALLIALFSFLLIPFGLSNAVRTNRQNFARIEAQQQQQLTQLQEVKGQVDGATDEQLQIILTQLAAQQGNLEAIGISSTDDLKNRLRGDVAQAEQNTKQQAEAEFQKRRFALMKSTIKWTTGAFISGILYLIVWRWTKWARASSRRGARLRA